MVVADLKGTAAYDKLQAAWDAGEPVPKLFTTLDKDVKEMETEDVWGATLDETMVHVEPVIAYWSRSLKCAERNYSVTEREALWAKEALVRFQPFIEGEQVILMTDHAALQRVRVYENANRRLAAWGAVFAAYPGLKIIHRAGRVHSNVDPLSRLLRTPPHESPVLEDMNTIVQDAERRKEAQRLEDKGEFAPAKKAVFAIWWWEDAIDKYALPVATRQQKAKERELEQGSAEQTKEEEMIRAQMEVQERDSVLNGAAAATDLPFEHEDHWTYPAGVRPERDEEDWNKRSHLLISASPEVLGSFRTAYEEDPYFKDHYVEEVPNPDKVLTPSRFQKGRDGLLYFVDADWKTRLCVPHTKVKWVM
jgi:hypothetical protein